MKYRSYTKEFQLDALNLVKTNGYAATSRELGVSHSGYYKWRNEMPTKAQLEHRYCSEIKKAWEDSSKTYGAPRIYSELLSKGINISQKKVAQLMKKQGISGAGKKPSSYCTTDSVHSHEVAARHFKTEANPVPALSANKV